MTQYFLKVSQAHYFCTLNIIFHRFQESNVGTQFVSETIVMQYNFKYWAVEMNI